MKKTAVFGFTLIELLIVMGMISGLATLFITTYPSALKRARDTHRRNDLKQYQNLIEVYANNNDGLYPISNVADPVAGAPQVIDPYFICGSSKPLGDNACVQDPRNAQSVCGGTLICGYRYITDSGGTSYLLFTTLEQVKTSGYHFLILCSNGKAYEGNVRPTLANYSTICQ